MKIKILLLALFVANSISAQLTITPNTQVAAKGNIQLTLRNMDLINNGNFLNDSSRVSFAGNAISSISGSEQVRFIEMEIRKGNNSSVRLQRDIEVRSRVIFTSGFLNLNSFNTNLGSSGRLDGEQENTRVVGPNGGEVLFRTNLNAPSAIEPANLGMVLTSNQNLGNVTIKRGHLSQTTLPGIGSSLLRYYELIPDNNVNLNATLRIKYFNGELNGLDETLFTFFQSANGVVWSEIGFTSKDTIANFVQKTGVGNLSRFTLSSGNNSTVPVHFSLFNTRCDGNKVLIKWKTAQEQNSSHFNIERSADGIRWTVIGNLSASGNSNTERNYSFTDNNPSKYSYYRIVEHALDGRKQYTGILRTSCDITDLFSIWPNPVRDAVFMNIVSGSESTVIVKLFDSKGALMKVQRTALLQGSNQIKVNVNFLPKGIYSLYAEWNNGQMKKVAQVLKE